MRGLRRSHHRSIPAVVLACLLSTISSAQSATPPVALRLDDAIHLGIAHYPAAKSAAADVLRAKAGLAEARAMALPKISGSEEAEVSTDPVFAFGTKLRQARFGPGDFAVQGLDYPGAIGNFASSTSATWMAFDSGATQKRIRSARESEQASQLYSAFTEQHIADAVTKLFYRTLLAESQVGIAQANLLQAQEIASDVHDRIKSGLGLEADGMRADLTVRKAEDDLASTNSNVRVAREDLYSAIGVQSQGTTLVAPIDTDSLPSQASHATLVARSDLRALDLQQQSAEHNLAAIRSSRGPTLSTYAHAESDNPHFTGGGSTNWTVGAKLEITLFDGGVRHAQEQEAAAQLAKIAATKAQTQLEAQSTQRTLEAQVEDLIRRHATASEAIRAEEEGLKSSRDRYAAGLVSIVEVLTGMSDLSIAEFDLIRTDYQLRIAQSELKFVTGTLTLSKTGKSE